VELDLNFIPQQKHMGL